MENNQSQNVNQALLGLNLDSVESQLKPGTLTFAMNAQLENFDGGEKISYQNESSNDSCITNFPVDYVVIGVKNITFQNKTIYFLTNPYTMDSEIGTSINGECSYSTLITDVGNDMKFNFSFEHPIQKIEIKATNCSTQVFWTDGYNSRRYIDLDDLPWKEVYNPSNDFKPTKLVGQLDSNKLLIQPTFSIPLLKVESVGNGGDLKMGSYQFALQYANINSQGYTSYYNVTNPIGIFEPKITPDYDLPTGKSINLTIDNLDTSGLYEYFNLVVIKTINNITSVELIDTLPISGKQVKYNFSGNTKDNIRLTIADIFEKFPYYDIAEDLTQVDNVLVFSNLTKSTRQNYQEIWSNVDVYWESWTVPYNKFEGYSNSANTGNIRAYMGDEVYALEGCFIKSNGEQTDSFPIPGRVATNFDRDVINNLDSVMITIDKCTTPDTKQRWQVYNTATVTGFSPEYNSADECYIGPYKYGRMGYWESDKDYPNNPDIFGTLAGQPIRHHRFPDSLVSPIHDNNTTGRKDFEHRIFPLGIKIDADSMYQAINNSSLTEEEKNQIVGFKILRGNRVNNKSVIAKGMFNNVGKYTYEEETYYFPNYPYNDLRKDPYFTKTELTSHSGFRPDISLDAFGTNDSKSRFTFHSPDTHFYQPFNIDSGQLKIETIEYGESYGHFVKVKNNAEYKFLTKDAIYAAGGIGISSGFTLAAGTFGWPTYSPAPVIGTFQATKQLFLTLIDYRNFGYSYNSVGYYNKSFAVPNDGYKQRSIDFGKYITDGKVDIEENNSLNNYRRESAIYLKTKDALLYPRQYSNTIPEDTSRYNLSSQNSNTYNITSFLSQLYQKSLTNSTEDIVTSEDVLSNSLLSSGDFDQITIAAQAVFTISTMLTEELPVEDDVYSVSGGNYKITKVTYEPIDSTNTKAVLRCEITNYTTGYSAPPSSGTLTLTFAADGTDSVSAATILYTNVVITPPSTPDTSGAAMRTAIQDFAATNPTPGDYNDLIEGNDFERYLYYIINIAYIRYLSNENEGVPPAKVRESNINGYYGSIKKYFPSQWGSIHSYEVIDTGFYQNLFDNNKQPYALFPTVFGGDTFITRFGYKSKVSLFSDTSFGEPNQTDIDYDKLGNYGYPMFWLSTRAEKINIDIKKEVDKLVKVIDNSPGSGSGNGSILGKIWTVIKGLVSGGFANVAPVMSIMIKIFKEIYRTVGIANINLDNYKEDGIQETGLIYMYVYGIPYFFVESEVNVDYRHASNEKDKNFYPNMGNNIPDEWLQEYNVPIIHDNSYEYNKSYSKQNKENYFSHLRDDYDPAKRCYKFYPNRAIYSDRSTLEENKNNWLVYRPSSYFDFSKSHGKLVSLDTIETRQVLARFENKTQIYNALTVVDISQGPKAYLGNDQLFSAPPIDLFETDTGFAGSQHKFLLKTEFGHIFTDSKRGQVILLDQSHRPQVISGKGCTKWFNRNLPFFITKSFPGVNTDNNFKDIGIHGVYDAYHARLILTKLDYAPLSENITYSDNKFWIEDNGFQMEIDVTNKLYFCDKSWTMSYSFESETWVSFHSYQPNYYVPVVNNQHFQSGIYTNNIGSVTSTLWNHDLNNQSFTTYYGTEYPYIIETPFIYKLQDEIVQGVRENVIARKYTTYEDYYEPEDTIFFNKAVLYNNEQCSGIRNLVPKPKHNLSSRFAYPIYNSNSIDILVTRSDNLYNYNSFWNIVKSTNTPFYTQTCDFMYTEKNLVNSNLDYTIRSNKKGALRGKSLKIRHILDNRHDVKLISKFISNETTKSFK